MSTVSETNQLDVGGWSPDTLHAWVRSMLDQIDRRNEQRFTEQENALEKALTASNEVVLANFTERDKAVHIREAFVEHTIANVDKALRDHIGNQLEKFQATIRSAETLEVTRIEGVKTQIMSVHREIDIETNATKTAITKADAANEKRFEAVNEFRAQMADQSALFISRREVEAMVGSQTDKVATLTDRINRSEGRGTGKEQLWGYAIGGIGLLLAVMMYFNSTKAAPTTQGQIDSLRDQIRQLSDANVSKPR